MMRVKIFAATVCFISQISFASVVRGPISEAMGRTGRGAVFTTESIFLNPAYVSLARGYHLGFGYYNEQPSKNQDIARTYNISVTDATTKTFIPAGLAYTNNRNEQRDLDNFSLAFGDYLTRWSWGVGYRYQVYKELESGDQATAGQVDLGALFRLQRGLALGVVAANLVPQSDDKPEELRDSRELGLGLAYSFDDFFRFQLDAVHRFIEQDENTATISPWFYGLGFETVIRNIFAVRGGVGRDETAKESFYSAGMAFLGPRLSANYSYSQDISDSERFNHKFDLSLPF